MALGIRRVVPSMHSPGRLAAVPRRDRAVAQAAAALDLLLPPRDRRFAIRFWDGTVQPPERDPAEWTLVINNPAVFRLILLHPDELALGEAFLRGDWDVEGDLERVFDVARAIAGFHPQPRDLWRLAPLLVVGALTGHGLPAEHPEEHRAGASAHVAHTREVDQRAIRYHYDVGNDFYRLWLDRQMIYSCAYFQAADADLEAAQAAKLDLICRKLRLQPGERFLDIGCGWGALVRHAAANYGVQALGITLSEAQAALARERIAAEGLGDRCRIEVRDYRDLPTTWFDKAASVGMAEHVGKANLPAYFDTIFRALKPDGLFLNHAIADMPRAGRKPKTVVGNRSKESFIERHVFPDGELVPLHDMLAAAEQVGFEACDVEGLRRHYALTLRHWRRRLEARRDEVLATADETTFRVWRLYMAGAAYSFEHGNLSIYQVLLSRPGTGWAALPLTREELYTTGSRTPVVPGRAPFKVNGQH